MAPTDRLFSDPAQVKYISNGFAVNTKTPFLVGQPVAIDSVAGTTMYGINHPGDASTTKYASFKQTISGNKAFALPAAVDDPQNTTGGALSAANQLRVVVLVEGVATLRARGDEVAAASTAIVAAGGGTAAGEAGLVVDGAHAAGVEAVLIEDGGANTETILVGDKIEFSGANAAIDYFMTATTASLNGTTSVSFAITPPLVYALAGGETVTVTAADGKTIILGTAPALNSKVEVLVMESGDVITETGGAMTAGRVYETDCKTVFYTVGNVNLTKAM